MARVRFPDDAFALLGPPGPSWSRRSGPRASVACKLTVAQLVERGTVNDTVVIPRSMVRIRPVRLILLAGWPSGLRRWFKAPVSSEARVRISHQSLLVLGQGMGPGCRLGLPCDGMSKSEVAQRKRVGLITQRSEDRNLPSLLFARLCH